MRYAFRTFRSAQQGHTPSHIMSDPQEATQEELKAEFDRISNTPSPNPRYGGKTPLEIARALMRPTKKMPKAAK